MGQDESPTSIKCFENCSAVLPIAAFHVPTGFDVSHPHDIIRRILSLLLRRVTEAKLLWCEMLADLIAVDCDTALTVGPYCRHDPIRSASCMV